MYRTTVGYAGGSRPNPDYHNLGDHSEVVRIEFDPQQVSYAQLLEVFWESHEPNSVAYRRQYRNAVFTLDDAQRRVAEQSLKKVAEETDRDVHTAIEPAGTFYAAEAYHQKYMVRRAYGLLSEFQTIYPDDDAFAASTAVAKVNGYLGCNGQAETFEEEVGALGLSPQSQKWLVEYLQKSCRRFNALTCPAPR